MVTSADVSATMCRTMAALPAPDGVDTRRCVHNLTKRTEISNTAFYDQL
jgi:hypothetical protein